MAEEHRSELKAKFQEVATKKDFFDLLMRAIECLPISNSETHRFKERLKNFHITDSRENYHSFTVRKSSGKDRLINAPVAPLKFFQRLVNVVLSCVFEAHPNAFGFRKNGSIVQNASLHVNQHYVFNIDLKDFFTSIDDVMLISALENAPFGFKGKKSLLGQEIVRLCTMKMDLAMPGQGTQSSKEVRVLPQGAPTSPLLSNVVCLNLDIKLTGLAKRFGITYSRYADDITFSSNRMVFGQSSSFLQELKKIIIEQKFSINESKTRLQHMSQRQEVTGLVVNKKINVEQKFIKAVRMYLYYWEKYGYPNAQGKYYADQGIDYYYPESKSLLDTLDGRLNFLKMVKGEDDSTYVKLAQRFKKLSGSLSTRKHANLNPTSSEVFEEHRPVDVATFLRLFQHGEGLKYLTHDYDLPGREFQYDKIMDLAGREFNGAFRSYSITRSLYARAKHFCFERRPKWWRWENGKKIDINVGWGSPELKEWIADNPGVHPIRMKVFRDQFIRPFKESIQFRAPMLHQAVVQTLEEKFGEEFQNFEIELINLESAEFFTDVDIFLGGVRHILDGILERVDVSKRIRIEFKRQIFGNHNMKILEITHIRSKCHRDANIVDLMNGNFREVARAFKGLCNWSITSSFSDGNYTLKVLDDNPGSPSKMSVDEDAVYGFTHTLSFY
ncbi:hypothetical protein GM921_09645 [Pedobacter sp. LMG 31464]|uniref:RNA-directed DNA polymerase n=1 Tax=Pedobacter planticolens TaxID=2679964 RepID=A0A923E1B6_9SPHI|nr:reverse transcriptase domain-containing protein [Pedobacter planticolens]MBB2145749.1 hypothetical protein [Pedobacter planticolens]